MTDNVRTAAKALVEWCYGTSDRDAASLLADLRRALEELPPPTLATRVIPQPCRPYQYRTEDYDDGYDAGYDAGWHTHRNATTEENT